MSMESEFFKEAQPDFARFSSAGFARTKIPGGSDAGEVWKYSEEFMDGDFRAEITVTDDGEVSGRVLDLFSEEEYLPLRVPEQNGPFVSTVRYEYEKLLRRIFDRCFTGIPGGGNEEDVLYDSGMDRAGRKHWIIPANPVYYDLIPIFDREEITGWKQGKGIALHDIVYIYVAAPYSAILYKCEVVKTHVERYIDHKGNEQWDMSVRILERYDKHRFTLKDVLSRFDVRYVRGPRFMPEELEKYIEEHK